MQYSERGVAPRVRRHAASLFAIALCAASACGPAQESRLSTESDIPGPSLAKGEDFKRLVAEAKGKPLVINIWATWCLPCIEEMPELVQFYRERDPAKAGFLSVSVDAAYSFDDKVVPFVQSKELPFPVYVQDGMTPEDLSAALGVAASRWDGAVPATFILDKEGELKKHWFEEIHAVDITRALQSLS
jgi:thiol-disulfide isomerase/thioredoxin